MGSLSRWNGKLKSFSYSFVVLLLLVTVTEVIAAAADKSKSKSLPGSKKVVNPNFACPDNDFGPTDDFGLEAGSHSKVSEDTFRYLVGCNPQSLKETRNLEPTRYRILQRYYIHQINKTLNEFNEQKFRKRARRVPLCVRSTKLDEIYHDQMGRFYPIIQELEHKEELFKDKPFYEGDPSIWYPQEEPGVHLDTDTDFGVEDIRLFRIFTGDPRMPVLRQWFHLAIYMRADQLETQEREGIIVQAISAPLGLPFGEFRIDFDCDNPKSPLLSRRDSQPITHGPGRDGFYKDSLVFPCSYRSRYHLRHPNVFTVGGNPSLPVQKYSEFHVHFNWIDATCYEAVAMQFLIVLVKSFKDKTYDVFYTPALNHTFLDSNDGLPYPFYPGWKKDKTVSCNGESVPMYEEVSQEFINSGNIPQPRHEHDIVADIPEEDLVDLESEYSEFFKNPTRNDPAVTEPEPSVDSVSNHHHKHDVGNEFPDSGYPAEKTEMDDQITERSRKSESAEDATIIEDVTITSPIPSTPSTTTEASQAVLLADAQRSRNSKRKSVLKEKKVPLESWVKRKKRGTQPLHTKCTDRTSCIMGQFQIIRKDIAIIPFNKEYDDCVMTGQGISPLSPLECPPEAVQCLNYFTALDVDVENIGERRIAFRAEILKQRMCDICSFPDDSDIFRNELPPDIPVAEPTRAGSKGKVNSYRRPVPIGSLMDISYKGLHAFDTNPNETRVERGSTQPPVTFFESSTTAELTTEEIIDNNPDGHIPIGKLKYFDRLIIYENQASKLTHGALLIVAWFFLIPVANYTARYFKESGGIKGGYGICGMPIWLLTHVGVHVFAFLCMGIGLIEVAFPINIDCERLPIVADRIFCEGESNHGKLLTAHKVFGWLTFSCLLPQLFLGWIRPVSTRPRWIIQVIHSCVGYAGYICAAISAYLIQTCLEIYFEVTLLLGIHMIFFGVGCYVQQIQDRNLLIDPPRRVFPVLEVREIWEDPPNRKHKNILQLVHAILLGVVTIILVINYLTIGRNDPLTNLNYPYDQLNTSDNRLLVFHGLFVPGSCQRTNYIYLFQQIACDNVTAPTFWCNNPLNYTL